ncbi:MAG: hypothetical protein AMS27_14450 [Bacteroides sp. SM23_62_1]|nr:MAG: hypothetical protein AMS27_14450 [Bacteroides sp. SM23_62_1]
MNRKDFIRVSGRWMMFGLLAMTAGVLLNRKQVGSKNACRVGNYCGQCKILAGCSLPKALKYKENEKE